MTPRVEVESLAAPFGKSAGLSDISFSVGAGELLVLLGPSGAGKTTLLKTVAGFVTATSGHVRIAERDVTGLPPEKRDAVYLHQSPVLFPHLSVTENVAFPLRVRRVDDNRRRERVAELLAAMQIPELAGRMPRTLSGGQRNRVSLARALAADPMVLLLDEPFSGLDPGLREDVREAIRIVQRTSAPATVVVTHDLDDAAVLADRIGVMINGRLCQIGNPREVLTRPSSQEIATLVGFTNTFAARADGEGNVETAIGKVRVSGGEATGPGTVMFRTDGGRLTRDGEFRGRVIAITTRPGSVTVTLHTAVGDLELAAEYLRLPSPGDEVEFTLHPEHLIFFPAS
ncbi:MAG: ABC transporter ATP-binding protein [Gemmatimonadaceae bacterium]|nr:ABC transporter ATP-binding protein [Gemmatimonadaceae bacterium]